MAVPDSTVAAVVLTYLFPGFHMKIIFCNYDTFDDNCRTQHTLGKNLEEIWRFVGIVLKNNFHSIIIQKFHPGHLCLPWPSMG